MLHRIPAKFWRFYGVGTFTSGLCWLIYEGLYTIELHPDFREASAWALSYSLTSVLAHYLHFRITFEPRRNYRSSLWRTLLVYGSSMVLSTLTDHMLAEQMHHRVAWFVNMGAFGLLNFFVLRYYAYREFLPAGLGGMRGE